MGAYSSIDLDFFGAVRPGSSLCPFFFFFFFFFSFFLVSLCFFFFFFFFFFFSPVCSSFYGYWNGTVGIFRMDSSICSIAPFVSPSFWESNGMRLVSIIFKIICCVI